MVVGPDATVTMRDGMESSTDVFRPVDAEAVPVIVAWGPCGKHGPVKYDLFYQPWDRPRVGIRLRRL